MKLLMRLALPGDEVYLAKIMSDAAAYKLAVHQDIAWQDWGTGSTDYSQADVAPYIEQQNTYIASVAGKPAGAVSLDWQDPQIWGTT